ncbi:hypothetical protein MRB53_041184 [Persea americana]|nr:hypothetical protein MRB53_041184 [Persea americana]
MSCCACNRFVYMSACMPAIEASSTSIETYTLLYSTANPQCDHFMCCRSKQERREYRRRSGCCSRRSIDSDPSYLESRHSSTASSSTSEQYETKAFADFSESPPPYDSFESTDTTREDVDRYLAKAEHFNASRTQHVPVPLKVTGKIPSWVAGNLLRTGPGFYQLDTETGKPLSLSHWFDGFTVMHRFALTPSKADPSICDVSYNSRCQVDEMLEASRKTGKLEGTSFGNKRDPCDSFYKKMKVVFEKIELESPKKANIGVAIQPTLHGKPGKNVVTVTSDRIVMKEFDLETLEPLGVTNQSGLNSALKGQLSAAHSERDPITGDLYNYNLELGPKITYRAFCTSASTGETKVLAEVSGKDIRGAYLHSMFLTKHFLIICIWGGHYGTGIKILWERNLLDAMAPLDPKVPTTWLVIDRVHGRGLVHKFTSPAFFAFHTTNAWEETTGPDGKVDIVAELVQYSSIDLLHKFYYRNLVSSAPGAGVYCDKESTRGALVRYKLPGITLPTASTPAAHSDKKQKVAVGTAHELVRLPSPNAGDLQTINPAYATIPHRYVYGVCDTGLSSFNDGIVKTDVDTRSSTRWTVQGHTPGEPIFVARPGGSAEDDGVLMTVVLDGRKGTSYLLVLDARNLSEVGRAECDVAVGFGFHGRHLAAEGPAPMDGVGMRSGEGGRM